MSKCLGYSISRIAETQDRALTVFEKVNFVRWFSAACFADGDLNGGVIEWLRHSISNLVRSTCVGSNPVIGITNHRPTANTAGRLSESVNEYSEATLRAQSLDTH